MAVLLKEELEVSSGHCTVVISFGFMGNTGRIFAKQATKIEIRK